MDVEKWKAAFHKAFSGERGSPERGVKLAVLAGICGIILICLSSLLGKGQEKAKETGPAETGPTLMETAAYEERLEQELSRIVRAITGEEAPEVLVTLESGSRYVYASDERTDSQEDSEKASEEKETAHIILKDSDGAQRALTVTEIQPKVKGVVIVSRYAGDPGVREKLTQAAKTALDISSAKVCVTDTG